MVLDESVKMCPYIFHGCFLLNHRVWASILLQFSLELVAFDAFVGEKLGMLIFCANVARIIS